MKYKIPESVLVVIHTDELEVLLLERADKPTFWQSVTGSKDTEDEPLPSVAIREVWEETGIIVQEDGLPLLSDASSGGAGQERNQETIATSMAVPVAALLDWQLSNVYEIYPVWRHRYAPGVVRNTEHVFSLQVPRDIGIVLSPREHLQYCWLPYREAADRCFSSSNAEAILQLPVRLG